MNLQSVKKYFFGMVVSGFVVLALSGCSQPFLGEPEAEAVVIDYESVMDRAVSKIDLVAGSISYSSSRIVGQSIFFDSSIKNSGSSKSGAFNVKWKVDSDVKSYGSHVGISAGSTVSNDFSYFSWTPTVAGTYTVSFVVDCSGLISESNEGNNTKSVTFTVKNGETPYHKNIKVLVLNYDPVLGAAYGNKKVSDHYAYWTKSAVLAQQYMNAINLSSHGSISYTIAEWKDINGFAPENDASFNYTADNFVTNYDNGGPEISTGSADYKTIISTYDIVKKVEAGTVDQVWVFGPPKTGGLYESAMAGNGAYWINGIADGISCSKKFVVFGFNYERDVGCMLENTGHMTEWIMHTKTPSWTKRWSYTVNGVKKKFNDWERFMLTESNNYDQIYFAPGNAQVGTIHYPVNGVRDYDWFNVTKVKSYADDWYNYPNFKGVSRIMDNTEWNGDGSENVAFGSANYSFITWWFRHIPHFIGTNNGILNNWWPYIMDVNKY